MTEVKNEYQFRQEIIDAILLGKPVFYCCRIGDRWNAYQLEVNDMGYKTMLDKLDLYQALNLNWALEGDKKTKTKIKIETKIEIEGVYCGSCDHLVSSAGEGVCNAFEIDLKKKVYDYYYRCDACLKATGDKN